jgi:aminoglycoside phosphotransferase (APT) family kinase protein
MSKPISRDHLRTILDVFQPGLDLVHVSRPGQGIASDILLLDTSRMPLVLKRYCDADDWKPRKEQAVFAHLRRLGIPAPEVLAVDTSQEVVPFGWSLTERLPGEAWSSVAGELGPEANEQLYGELGDYLGRMHATTFDRVGDVGMEEADLAVHPAHQLGHANGAAPGPYERWVDMHRDIVRARLNLMRGTPFEDLVPAVEEYVARHEHLIEGEVRARLLHMDLHQGNLLISDDAISGILDVEEAIAGHNEYDLMRTELANFRGTPPEYEAAFLAAYGTHVPLDSGMQARKPFYEVSRTLAWIQSLLLHGTSYTAADLANYVQAARSTLEALLREG